MKKILLIYKFRPDHENLNSSSARLATCQEAYDELRKLFQRDDINLPELPSPETVTSIESQSSDIEDWDGFQLIWGDNPSTNEIEEGPCLSINGIDIGLYET